jgi:hypothetical protein
MNWLVNIPRRLVSGLVDFSPGCRTAARLQSEALDHKLAWRQQLGLRIHLMLCKWCSRYGKQIAFIHNVAPSRPDEVTAAVPQPLSDEARERIRKQLRANLE